MLNLLLVDKLLVRVVATISLSQVCWHVFSPGAEINQNSVMAASTKFVHPDADVRKSLKGNTLIRSIEMITFGAYVNKGEHMRQSSVAAITEGNFAVILKCKCINA